MGKLIVRVDENGEFYLIETENFNYPTPYVYFVHTGDNTYAMFPLEKPANNCLFYGIDNCPLPAIIESRLDRNYEGFVNIEYEDIPKIVKLLKEAHVKKLF